MHTVVHSLECKCVFSSGVRPSFPSALDVIYGCLNDLRHLSFVQTAQIGFLSDQRREGGGQPCKKKRCGEMKGSQRGEGVRWPGKPGLRCEAW